LINSAKMANFLIIKSERIMKFMYTGLQLPLEWPFPTLLKKDRNRRKPRAARPDLSIFKESQFCICDQFDDLISTQSDVETI
jgi:hypothetical protein